ncbi:MAG: flagellar assembly peptidoglycan hydrolase FlgJ [Methylophilus sp.]|nr:flagellar assembly peptidoglycan hydrolase FlgJ [Methylophilus sp.]
MINGADLSGKVAFDANSLNNLKQAAKENSPEALKTVAKQFEGILMNMMLKSMREANPQDGEFDNEQSRMFTSMLDQQLTSNLSAKGLGLADVLVRQLSKTTQTVVDTTQKALSEGAAEITDTSKHVLENLFSPTQPSAATPNNSAVKPAKSSSIGESVTNFIDKMLHHAKDASNSTGVPTHLMLGQAALESGWGKREIKAADGTPSHNLFGIKANASWKGKTVETMTTEYINGVKQNRIEKFRAYDSYADSFKDFANLMKSNPRYQHVIANVNDIKGYAQAMQNAGYATDPQYAKKLSSVIHKIVSA